MAVTHRTSRQGASVSVLGEHTTLMTRHPTYSLFERSADPGQGLPPHVHDDQDETIYVLAGSYDLRAGEDQLTLTPGSVALIPRGTVHSLTASGDEPARCLAIFDPPGAMELFYDEVRTAGDAGADVVLAIARRLGITLLTSPV